MASGHVTFVVDAPAEAVWHVIGTRWADVHRIVDRISSSRLVGDGGPGAGSLRECVLAEPVMGLTAVRERLTMWDPPRGFTYEMLDPPFPLARMRNRWEVEPDGDAARVTLTPDLELRARWATRWMEAFVLRRLLKDLAADVTSLKGHIEREARTRG